MRLQEVPDRVANELDFPVDLETVIDEIGHLEIEAPDSEDTQTIGELMGHLEEGRYENAFELADDILGNVPDTYIGRKHYDDRSPNPADVQEVRSDQNQSF